MLPSFKFDAAPDTKLAVANFVSSTHDGCRLVVDPVEVSRPKARDRSASMAELKRNRSGEERSIRRDGLHLFGLRYWDDVLSPWAGVLIVGCGSNSIRVTWPACLLRTGRGTLARALCRSEAPRITLGRPAILLHDFRFKFAAKALESHDLRSGAAWDLH